MVGEACQQEHKAEQSRRVHRGGREGEREVGQSCIFAETVQWHASSSKTPQPPQTMPTETKCSDACVWGGGQET